MRFANDDQSGNGSNQLDSDGNEVEMTDERAFGWVNLELAEQKGGDDRQSFLMHEPVDLLYYWDVMDHHDLIHFSTAQLRGPNAVSSESRPALTSYGASDNDSPNSGRGRSGERQTKRSRNMTDGDDVTKEMNENVSMMGEAMKEMNKQSMMLEINALNKDLQQLKNEWRKEKRSVTYESEEDGEYYKSSIANLEESIRVHKMHLDRLNEK